MPFSRTFLFFGVFFGGGDNVTGERLGYLKYKHPKTSQRSNVTVSLQCPVQFWSYVSTNDNALQKSRNNSNSG